MQKMINIKKMGKNCCVPRCKSGAKVPSHKFPKDVERCFQWIHSLKLDELKNYCAQDLKTYKVCYKHFSETDYSCSPRYRFLLKTAIPVMVTDTIDNNLHVHSQNEQSQQVREDIEQQNQVLQPSHIDNILLDKLQEHDQILMQHQDLLLQSNELTLQNQILEQETESLEEESQNEVIHNENNVQKNTEQSSSRRSKHVRSNLQNVTRVRYLSPTAKSLYDVVVKLRRRNRDLKRLVKECRAKTKIKSISLKRTNSTTPVREQFINMILRNNDVPPQARRFTTDDKVFCISLYKRSPACPLIIKYLGEIMKNITDDREKYVALVWDEMSLQPALSYNKEQDKIIGFEDWETNRTREIADHSITFYLRCLYSGNKMPLGYGFCQSATKTHQLIRCIKQWLSIISARGLIPVAVICDQGGTNIAAINALIDKTNKMRKMRNLRTKNSFIINNHEIVPIFDYVHLLKGVRNNLLTKDLDVDTSIKCIPNKKYASWDDIITTYEIDKNSCMKYRQMEKITDKHVIPRLIPKMRVKYASQIFSRTVSNFMDVILNLNGGVVQTQQGVITLSNSASTTCETVRFFNDLIDSFNGKSGQGLSSVITPTSGHISFWQEACKKLERMCYVKKETRKINSRNAPKCLKNWTWTMKGAQEVWNILHEANFQSLNLKFLSQDVIENFFSQIRSHGGADRNPTCEHFEGAFKTLLICNMTSKHSIGANCEESAEGTTLAFSHLMKLSKRREEMDDVDEIDEVECAQPAIPESSTSDNIINEKRIVDIIKRNKVIAQCQECANYLLTAQALLDIRQGIEILKSQFNEICHEVHLLEKTMKILEDQCFLSCRQQCTHLKEALVITTAEEFIKAWCQFINNILCRKIDVDSDNYMFKLAERLSTKYVKKISDTKPDTRLQIKLKMK